MFGTSMFALADCLLDKKKKKKKLSLLIAFFLSQGPYLNY